MKTLSFSFLVFGMVYGAIGNAATGADFYCSEIPQARPAYYDLAVNNCGNGKSQGLEGVCTQTVLCTYLNDDLKKAAKESLKKDFSKLTELEKRTFMKENSSAEWLPSTLTCRGTKTSVGPICPSPEQCKEGVFYNLQGAFISPSEFKEIQQRQARGNGRVFPVKSSSDAGSAK